MKNTLAVITLALSVVPISVGATVSPLIVSSADLATQYQIQNRVKTDIQPFKKIVIKKITTTGTLVAQTPTMEGVKKMTTKELINFKCSVLKICK